MKYKESKRAREFDLLCNELDSIYHQIATTQGLSDSAYEILRTIIILGEGCTQTNIYVNTFLNKQTVNSSVKKLIEDEILLFKSGKGRENEIYFTDKGKQIVKQKIIPIENIENAMFDDFTVEEYNELVRLTTKYIETLKERVSGIIGKGEMKNGTN